MQNSGVLRFLMPQGEEIWKYLREWILTNCLTGIQIKKLDGVINVTVRYRNI